ncbi:hypothetical protein BG004_005036 [Podila humilis]|nr:hypothetical protein BG004_005036 [Podila humilis]
MHRALELDDVRCAIGPFLPYRSLLVCIRVCRDWNASFTPFIWRHLDIGCHWRPPAKRVWDANKHRIVSLTYDISYRQPRYVLIMPKLTHLELTLSYQGWEQYTGLVANHQSTLRNLSFQSPDGEVHLSFLQALAACTSLEHITVNNLSLSKTTLPLFWNACLCLISLTINLNGPALDWSRHGEPAKNDTSKSDAAKDVLIGLPKSRLKHFRIVCSDSSGHTLLRLLAFCPELESLVWQGGSRPDKCPSILAELYGVLSVGTWPSLRSLKLLHTQTSDPDLSIVIESIQQLTELTLPKSTIGCLSICTLMDRHCSTIRILRLSGCPNLTGRMVQTVLSSATALEVFHATRIGYKDIVVHGKPWICARLRELRICIDMTPPSTSEDGNEAHSPRLKVDQHVVFERLSTLTSLQLLSLEGLTDDDLIDTSHRGLDLRLMAGLGALTKLTRLECLEFASRTQQFEEEEVEWVRTQLPSLGRIYGRVHFDPNRYFKLKEMFNAIGSTPTRQGIIRNTSSAQSPTAPVRSYSIIPPPEPFDDDSDLDSDIEETQEDKLTEDQLYQNALAGRWGEGPSKVDVVDAERDFRKLERTLTSISRRSSARPGEEGVVRRKSSRKQRHEQKMEKESLSEEEQAQEAFRKEGDFDLEYHLKNQVLPAQQASGIKARTMGVVWKDLSVIGEGVGNQYIATTGDPFKKLFNLVNPFFWVRKCTGRHEGDGGGSKITKTILYPMNGVCQDGEMILVLGRPGAGCSTLLRVLANDRKNYKKVLGEVSFNSLSADTVSKHYKGEVLYNQEDDFHYPTLTVRQTLETAIRAKTPRARLPGLEKRKDFRDQFLDVLTKMYGLTRQKETLVGNAFIRGISGGERKRLSIAEQMATRSSVNMWDGSTRGLDASSALDYVKSLRVSTNLLKKATMVSIYQASENIYDLFDKVLLLYDGHCIFFGPAEDARDYFINMGFDCPTRQTTADFLTAVTDPHERRPAPGVSQCVAANLPQTADQFEIMYKQSLFYEKTLEQIRQYEQQQLGENSGAAFIEASRDQKQKRVSVKNPYTLTFWNQVLGMAVRQIQLTRGDLGSLISRYLSVSTMFS